jgi:hypothetical protein
MPSISDLKAKLAKREAERELVTVTFLAPAVTLAGRRSS